MLLPLTAPTQSGPIQVGESGPTQVALQSAQAMPSGATSATHCPSSGLQYSRVHSSPLSAQTTPSHKSGHTMVMQRI